MHKLTKDFYRRDDVVQISKELLGKYLFTKFDNELMAGIITETEAYAGISDKASHAYGNRRTKRTEVMYSNGGVAYVYLCYGMHHLFNIVTNKENIPHAVLIRAIKPVQGIEMIVKRRKRKIHQQHKDVECYVSTDGPANLTQALGIKTLHTGIDLCGNKIWIEDKGIKVLYDEIHTSARVGVAYAGDDAFLPYRFQVKL